MVASYRLVAKMPTIAAMAYKYSVGQPFIYPRNDLGYAENTASLAVQIYDQTTSLHGLGSRERVLLEC